MFSYAYNSMYICMFNHLAYIIIHWRTLLYETSGKPALVKTSK